MKIIKANICILIIDFLLQAVDTDQTEGPLKKMTDQHSNVVLDNSQDYTCNDAL